MNILSRLCMCMQNFGIVCMYVNIIHHSPISHETVCDGRRSAAIPNFVRVSWNSILPRRQRSRWGDLYWLSALRPIRSEHWVAQSVYTLRNSARCGWVHRSVTRTTGRELNDHHLLDILAPPTVKVVGWSDMEADMLMAINPSATVINSTATSLERRAAMGKTDVV